MEGCEMRNEGLRIQISNLWIWSEGLMGEDVIFVCLCSNWMDWVCGNRDFTGGGS